jgi:hypothetical protein
MKKNVDAASREVCTAFKLGNITYAPHYRNKDVFVGPGYPRLNRDTFSKNELLNAGLKQIEMLGWPRGEYGVVNQQNP